MSRETRHLISDVAWVLAMAHTAAAGQHIWAFAFLVLALVNVSHRPKAD